MNITPYQSWPLMALAFLFSSFLMAQPCETVVSTLGFENIALNVQEGSEDAKLTLFPLLGNEIIFPITGQLEEGLTVTSGFEYRQRRGGSCASISNRSDYPVAIFEITPDRSAKVNFQQTPPFNTEGFSLTLFKDSFDPTVDNCPQFVSSSWRQIADGNFENQTFLSADLVGGATYFLVVLPGQNTNAAYPRNYSFEVQPSQFNGDLPVFYDNSTSFAPNYSYTFLAIDPEEPFTILGVSSTGDFTNILVNEDGSDRVLDIFGLNYDENSIDTLTLLNSELTEVQDNGQACLYLSDNNINIAIRPATAAPVDWLTFMATPKKTTIKLDWDVAAETENDYFRVERSSDGGVNWLDIGEVSGNGTTQTYAAFTFTDMNPAAGANYYRLAQIDFDGTVNLSVVVQASIDNGKEAVAMTSYPNPFKGDFNVTAARAGDNAPIRIFDLQGREVTSRVTISLDGQKAQITADALPTGIYLLRWGSEQLRVVKY